MLCLDSRFSPSITLSGEAYEPPPRETVGVFLDELHARGIVAPIRRPRRVLIDGMCGQLRTRSGAL